MTYIKRFEIEGLAGRSHTVAHELRRHTNIFWGLNGTGKTTVLHILNAALADDTDGLDALPFESARVVFASEMFNRDIERTYSKRAKSGNQTAAHTDTVHISRSNSGRAWRAVSKSSQPVWESRVLGPDLPTYWQENGEDLGSGPFQCTFLPISRVLNATNLGSQYDVANSFAERVTQVWRLYSAQSLELIETIQRGGLASVLAILFGGRENYVERDITMSSAGGSISPRDAFAIVSEFLSDQRLYLPLGEDDFIRRYGESSENRQVVKLIESINARVEAVREPQSELAKIIDEMYVGNKRLEIGGNNSGPEPLSIRAGADRIPMNSLSSGEKQVLQILLETLAAESSSVLVDEPELSMHPDWQKRLVGSMRRVNRSAQFILASHSPDLMVDVADECVFEL